MPDTPAMLCFVLDNGAFLHWLLAVGLTLLVLDIFFSTEYLSWVSIAAFAGWGTWIIGMPMQWSVLVFMVLVAVGFALYYALWARLVRPFVLRAMLKSSPPEDLEALVGRHGTVRGSGDSMCVKVQDEYWPIAEDSRPGLTEGASVIITAFKDGFVEVSRN